MNQLHFFIMAFALCACDGNSANTYDPADTSTSTTPLTSKEAPTGSSKTQPISNSILPSSKITLSYAEPTKNNRFLSVTLLRDGEVVRIISSEEDVGGAFEVEKPTRLSPDKRFLYLTQIESAELETPQGTVTEDRAYCSLIETKSGCIAARETGEFCAGQFAPDNKWNNSTYPEFDIMTGIVKAEDYASGKRTPVDSPESSFENLLACDPITHDNIDAYRSIINEKLFSLDVAQQQALTNKIQELASETN